MTFHFLIQQKINFFFKTVRFFFFSFSMFVCKDVLIFVCWCVDVWVFCFCFVVAMFFSLFFLGLFIFFPIFLYQIIFPSYENIYCFENNRKECHFRENYQQAKQHFLDLAKAFLPSSSSFLSQFLLSFVFSLEM